MRGNDAKKVCPNIQLIQVPVARGKADLNLYRNAGSEVVSILSRKGRCERASIDEVYLDLTDAAELMLSENPPEILEVLDEEVLKSHILGLTEDQSDKKIVKEWLCRSDADHQDKLLACGAIIVAGLQMDVLKETMFTCSAGIAHNKMLAKLASAMHKPAQQTVVPSSSVKDLLASLPVKKMKQLGGKLGSSLQSDLGVTTVGDLLLFSEGKLQDRYGVNTGMSQTLEEAFARIEKLEKISLMALKENENLKIKIAKNKQLLEDSIADSDGRIAEMNDTITEKDEALKLAKAEIKGLEGSIARSQEIIKELEEKNLAQEAQIKEVLDEKKRALQHLVEQSKVNKEHQVLKDYIDKTEDSIRRVLLLVTEREEEHACLQKEVALRKEMDIKIARKEALGENKSASLMEDEKETNKKAKKKNH